MNKSKKKSNDTKPNDINTKRKKLWWLRKIIKRLTTTTKKIHNGNSKIKIIFRQSAAIARVIYEHIPILLLFVQSSARFLLFHHYLYALHFIIIPIFCPYYNYLILFIFFQLRLFSSSFIGTLIFQFRANFESFFCENSSLFIKITSRLSSISAWILIIFVIVMLQ